MNGRRAGLAAALSALAALATAPAASADPRVDLDRCDGLDRTALRRAVDAELAGLAAEKRAAVGDGVVVVDCPDAVTAHLKLEPSPATGPIARSLDLGEVPGELRTRLVALAVVEVVELAAILAGAVTPPPAPEVVPPPPPDRTSGIDPTPLGDRDPSARPPATAPSVVDDRRVDTAPPDPVGPTLSTRRALGDRGAILRGRAYVPRIGMRIYTGRAVPMLDAAFDVIQGAIALGVTAAIGKTDDPLGTVLPYLIAGTAGITVVCGRSGALELCASGRLTAGLAGVNASPADPSIEAASARAPYLELGGQLELAWRGRHRAGVLAIDAGWAEGLIATAGVNDVVRLDGSVIVATIGGRW
jgi:hypothetical protein